METSYPVQLLQHPAGAETGGIAHAGRGTDAMRQLQRRAGRVRSARDSAMPMSLRGCAPPVGTSSFEAVVSLAAVPAAVPDFDEWGVPDGERWADCWEPSAHPAVVAVAAPSLLRRPPAALSLGGALGGALGQWAPPAPPAPAAALDS
eukprot:gene3232-10794_t